MSNAKIFNLVQEFAEIARVSKIHVNPFVGSKRTLHVLELSGPAGKPVLGVYIKISNLSPGFWGIDRSQVDWLNKSGLEWLLVLLKGPDGESFVGAGAQVNQAIRTSNWSQQISHGQYKVQEQNIEHFRHFHSYSQLFNYIISQCQTLVSALPDGPQSSQQTIL